MPLTAAIAKVCQTVMTAVEFFAYHFKIHPSVIVLTMRILSAFAGLLTFGSLTLAPPTVALSPHPLIYRVDAITDHLVGQP